MRVVLSILSPAPPTQLVVKNPEPCVVAALDSIPLSSPASIATLKEAWGNKDPEP